MTVEVTPRPPVIGACIADDVQSIEFVRTSTGTSTLELTGTLPDTWEPAFAALGFGDEFSGFTLWEPQGYILTTADGATYKFERSGGVGSGAATLTEITDRNGNRITFNEWGIQHDAGPSVTFVRDSAGRVRKVIDPDLNEIEYIYDDRGVLVQVIDREQNTTEFVYNSDHGLIDIIDPRGISVAKNIYDDFGRLIAHVDAEGNRIEFTHCTETDPLPCIGANFEVVYDRLNVPTVYGYDDRGNVVSQQNGLGYATTYGYLYDPDDNLIESTTTDALTRIATQTFDDNGNLLTDVNFDGNPTSYAYDPSSNQVTQVTDPLLNLTLNEYDDYGNLTKVTRHPADGSADQVSLYTYDTRGNLASTTDPAGRVSESFYDGFGRLTRQEDPENNATTFEYDNLGRQTKVSRTVDAVEITTTTEYDAEGRATRTVDGAGNETLITYNEIGKQETVTNVDGITTYEYDLRGNNTRVIYPDTSTAEYAYDLEGRRTQTTDRDDRVTTTEYDSLGRVTKTQLPTEGAEVFTSTQYDEIGRVSARFGENSAAVPLQTYTYDTNKQTTLDAFNNPSIYEYDANGQLTTFTDARTKLTRYEYDGSGQRTKTIFHDLSESTSTYDAAGQLVAQADQAGVSTGFDYDLMGRLKSVTDAENGVTTYGYNAQGNRTSQTDALGRATTMTYDTLGRLTQRTLPAIPGEGTTPFETFVHDSRGRMTSHTAFDSQVTGFGYDINSRLELKTLPYTLFGTFLHGGLGDAHCSFAYTSFDDTIALSGTMQIDPLEGYTLLIEKETSPGIYTQVASIGTGSGTSFTGSWVTPQATDVADLEASLLYITVKTATSESRGRIIGARSPFVDYAYTPGGLRTSAAAEGFEHDIRGRLTEQTKANGDVLDYLYDNAGNRTQVKVTGTGQGAASTTVNYAFDAANRLSTVSDDGGTSFTSYSYDLVGNLDTVTYPNETQADYDYDDLNRLTKITHTRDINGMPDVFSSYTYTLGPAGNRERVVELLADATTRTVDYTYDDLYRLTREVVTLASGVERTVTFEYDKVGNRTLMTEALANGGLVSVTYTYDERDRLLTETRLCDPTCAIRMNPDGTYLAYMTPEPSAWDGRALVGFGALSVACLFAPFALLGSGPLGIRARRRWRRTTAITLAMIPLFIVGPEAIAQLYNQSALHRAAEAGMVTALGVATVETEYAYDTNGNQIEKKQDGSVVGAYTYDSENRLIQYDPQQGPSGIANYSYDDDGIRNAKSVGGQITTFTTDKNQAYAQVIEERDAAGTLVVSYTYGHDLISQSRSAGPVTRYYHYDGQMSTRNLSDANVDPAQVQVTDGYTYSAYGNLRDSTGTTDNDYLYTGEQYDESVQNYYLRARYYDQGIGRFTSHDPLVGSSADPDSLHRYKYCNNEPLAHYDPSGRSLIGAVSNTGLRGLLVSTLFGAVSGVFAYLRTRSLLSAVGSFAATTALLLTSFASPLAAMGIIAYALGNTPHASSQQTTSLDPLDAAELVTIVLISALLLAASRKSGVLSTDEILTLIRRDTRTAIQNLESKVSVGGAARNAKWQNSVSSRNAGAQGSLIHAETADLMRARGLTNLRVEVSYNAEGQVVSYGQKGSIRVDYQVLDEGGKVLKNFDLKSNDYMSPSRLAEFGRRTGADMTIVNYKNLNTLATGG